MSKAHAILHERGYVVPEDVQAVFVDVCAHRLVLRPQARVEGVTERDLLADILKRFQAPAMNKRWKNE
jgi:MoxR-like ATPase